MSLTRRSFLVRTSGVSLAAGMPPYIWTGPRRTPESKNDRLGVAVIGTGGRGSLIGHQAGTRGNMIACCDVDRRRAEGFAARYKGRCEIFGDYRRVLDRKDVDIVTIGVPDHWHAKIAIEAMKAGKDVYCEAPLGLTIDEGKLICRTVHQTRRILQVGTQQRSEYDGRFLQAVALARSGRLGQKLHAIASVGSAKRGGPFASVTPPPHLDWEFWLGQTPKVPYCPERAHYDFRWWQEYAGGQVTYGGIHHVDIAMWAMGLESTGPIAVEGHGDIPTVQNGYNVPTTFDCTMRFAAGSAIRLNSEKNGLVIEGDKGRIAIDRRRLTGTPVDELSKADREWLRGEVAKLCRGKQPTSHMANFFECVKQRATPISDVFTHHRALTACHLCNIAIKLGRKLHWDPDQQDFVGDAEATAMLSREQREPYTFEA